MQETEELNAELSRRIGALESQRNSESECFAPIYPVIYEAVLWVAGALLLWIAAVILV
jgi:hypothetical protein